MITMYGIPNCNTVKKARDYLEEAGVAYAFHNYKKQGVDDAALSAFIEAFGWEKVVNRKGMTWRKLSDEEKAAVTDSASAMLLMKEKSSVIKRPLVDTGSKHLLGFDEEEYRTVFGG